MDNHKSANCTSSLIGLGQCNSSSNDVSNDSKNEVLPIKLNVNKNFNRSYGSTTDELNYWFIHYSVYKCETCRDRLYDRNVHNLHLKNCIPLAKAKDAFHAQQLAMVVATTEEESGRRILRESSVPYNELIPQLSEETEKQPTIDECALPQKNFDFKFKENECNIYGGMSFDANIRNPLEIVTPGATYIRLGYLQSFLNQKPTAVHRPITKNQSSANSGSSDDLMVFISDNAPFHVATMEAFRKIPPPARPRITGSSKPRLNDVKYGCGFCLKNGDEQTFVKSHNLRDIITKKLTCPILRSHVCELCGATGDNSHTKSYCPDNPLKINMAKVKETPRNSTGIRPLFYA